MEVITPMIITRHFLDNQFLNNDTELFINYEIMALA